MNFKHELSPSKPLLRSTQSLILGFHVFFQRPLSKCGRFGESIFNSYEKKQNKNEASSL